MIQRWAEISLKKMLNYMRIVSIVGARQTGKTTMVQSLSTDNIVYKTFDDPLTLKSAQSDPVFFIRNNGSKCLAIDEVQKFPELTHYIKMAVDDNNKKGQFILTGSADFRKVPHANESLAGRTGFIRLRPFSEAEALGRAPKFLQTVFDRNWDQFSSLDPCDKPHVLELAIRGGYPGLLDSSAEVRHAWFRDYLRNQVFIDMKSHWSTRQSSVLTNLMLYMAVFSSKTLNKRELGDSVQGNFQKVVSYLSALEAMYLIDYLYPWTFKDYDRPTSSPKLFCTDSGLMAYMLNLKKASDIFDNPKKSANEGGKLVETWIYNQLMPEIELQPLWKINHFRSKTHEIDFLITGDNGHQLGIEVKSSETTSSDDAKHLKWFKNNTSEKFTGIVLYAGNKLGSFGDDCYFLPMSALWSR